LPGPVVVVIQYCQCIYRSLQTAKLDIGPAYQRHIGVIFADMEIDYDKLAAAILRQQQQQQPSVVPDATILNPSEQERGASSSNTGNFSQSTEHSETLRL